MDLQDINRYTSHLRRSPANNVPLGGAFSRPRGFHVIAYMHRTYGVSSIQRQTEMHAVNQDLTALFPAQAMHAAPARNQR